MTDASLESLDRQLIQLLSQRIRRSQGRSPSTSSLQIEQELHKAGVPPFVWNSLVTSCTAALATHPLRLPQEPQRCITLIGGRGMMAQFFPPTVGGGGP